MNFKEAGQNGASVTALLLILAFLSYSKPSLAISGNRWLKLKSDERLAYVGGVLDTWDDDVALCENKPEEPWCAHVKQAYEPIVLCVQHRPYKEIVAIVERYVKDHPEELERSMAGHIWISVFESCQKSDQER
jgi:hypothetical protein